MKKMSIKASILIPTLAVLIAGIIALVVIVSVLSSSTANDLSSRIVSARVNEYTNEFKTMSIDSYRVVVSLAPVIQQLSQELENPREEVISTLSTVLMANDNMLGIWTCW